MKTDPRASEPTRPPHAWNENPMELKVIFLEIVYLDLYSDKVWGFSIFSFCTPPGDIYGRPLLIFTRAGAVGNSWWGCIVPLGSPNFDHDPISDEKMLCWTLASKIHTRFQTWRGSQNSTYVLDRNYIIIAETRTSTKRCLSFLIIYNRSYEHIHTLP